MTQEAVQHDQEPHDAGVAARLNWLRAGVLGANDGIVSVAAVVVGVAGASTATGPIVAAGAAAAIGGAISMALGEYVSVSSSADSQRALIEKERRELEEMPEAELEELTAIYRSKGLSEHTAAQVAKELTAHDALSAHLEAELHLDEDEVASPWHAAFASAIAFSIGAALPFATAVFLPGPLKIPVTFIAVLLALAVTGALGARLGGAPMLRPTLRVLVGGAAALGVTFAIGSWLGVSGVV
ncbi:VIT1/CCC1 transporter family protein [Paeniglutamicibacter sp. R2-26]|uniref:VIT1/CCC1 transporter family protein n=1 Tax=Paeniglutamicibacter sp. R2-26 TaxID=3144417 RepID=UPI003EE55DAB